MSTSQQLRELSSMLINLFPNSTTTPSTLEQQYLFISSQVRECYAYYLLHHLCELTGAAALAQPKKQVQTNGGRRRQNGRSKPEETEEDDETPELPQTILFVSRCRTAAHLSLMLTELDIPNTPLHSHLSQRERLNSLNDFRAARKPLLIATDVGSRGLDIPEVEVVINWDVPRDPADYVHRVGRTARAGKKGTSITFVTESDVDLVAAVEERTGATMTEMKLPEEEVLEQLNKVTTAKRFATMELHEDKFGEKQDIRKKKQRLLEGKSDDKVKAKKRKSQKSASAV